MGTRGVIARRIGEHSFTGVYHHWDSYPEGLGQTLYHLYREQFDRDLPRMLHVLIDEHPAGWSNINAADFTTSTELRCYCHGDRSDESNPVTDTNACDLGCEWAYAFTENAHMLVTASFCPDGRKMIGWFGFGNPKATWKVVADVDLEGDEPDWGAVIERFLSGPVFAPTLTA
jgi:hypothetical protein